MEKEFNLTLGKTHIKNHLEPDRKRDSGGRKKAQCLWPLEHPEKREISRCEEPKKVTQDQKNEMHERHLRGEKSVEIDLLLELSYNYTNSHLSVKKSTNSTHCPCGFEQSNDLPGVDQRPSKRLKSADKPRLEVHKKQDAPRLEAPRSPVFSLSKSEVEFWKSKGTPLPTSEVDVQILREMLEAGCIVSTPTAEPRPVRVVDDKTRFNPAMDNVCALASLDNPDRPDPRYDYIPGKSAFRPKFLEASIPDRFVKALKDFAEDESYKDEGERRLDMSPKDVDKKIQGADKGCCCRKQSNVKW